MGCDLVGASCPLSIGSGVGVEVGSLCVQGRLGIVHPGPQLVGPTDKSRTCSTVKPGGATWAAAEGATWAAAEETGSAAEEHRSCGGEATCRKGKCKVLK